MKTKTLLLSVLALFLLIGVTGCEKEISNENIQIKDFSYFGCKKETSDDVTGFAAVRGFENEYIEYEADDDGCLYLKHVNAVFNCCPDTITGTIAVEGNTISIEESEKGPKCDCICAYDLDFKLGPLSKGSYTLIFSRDKQEYLRFSIDYNSSLKGKVVLTKDW